MESRAQREYGLDVLRVFAFGVLILYHSGMGYVTWGWHVKNNELRYGVGVGDAVRQPVARGREYGSYFEFWKTVFQFVPYPKGAFSWHHMWFVVYILV